MKKKNKKESNWILIITVLAFILSLIFSFISELLLSNVNVFIGMIILLVIIFIGIIFDMVGVSVTAADIGPFNAMSAKKMNGAKMSVVLIKNANKVSSFCNDVIGDICGIISGACIAYIASNFSNVSGLSVLYVTLFVTALTGALTIGGKAIGKTFAIKNNVSILYAFAKILSIFYKSN